MNSLKKIMMTIALLLSVVLMNAQIKNATTETVKIFGNCGMCKTKIEKAGNIKNIAKVDWNEDTKMATLTYDESKTNQDEILKRIALVGYDSEKFLAPADVYSKLPGCCQYDREAKVAVKEPIKVDAISRENGLNENVHNTMAENQDRNQLLDVFDNYFLVKDALVRTDSKTAALKSKELLASIEAVKMETLKMEVHMVWMKVLKDLTADAKSISETQDIKKQREAFKTLSKSMYEVIKVSKPTEAVYYQYCPMQDANWLSKENAVKNPYYGSQMLTCGKTVETIK
jgi:copper chaperone CopZ